MDAAQNAPLAPIETTTKTKTKTKTNVRHAEKRRTATCLFADRVAKLSIDRYRSTISEEVRPPQTCLATIVAYEISNDRLHLLSLGVGTKFLSEASLQEENASSLYGARLRDCHAEVLARRGFKRQLLVEILQDLQSKTPTQGSMTSSTAFKLLERRPMDEESPGSRYRLRAGITIHLYTSSAPCGNATLKKFAKMSRERFQGDLKPNEWPTAKHDPIHGSSIHLGQFALLIKKDNDDLPVMGNEAVSVATTEGQTQKRGRKSFPANESDDWTPPGTTIVQFTQKGSIHSCSDKIARWNILGLQGSTLSRWITEPVYLSTVTVGRKFTSCICRRALCCRLEPDPKRGNKLRKSQRGEVPRDNEVDPVRRINHPAILGTAVYMDETGVVETNTNFEGHDVRFHSSKSWCWWMAKDFGDEANSEGISITESQKSLPECIDGSTGYLVETQTDLDCSTPRCSSVSTRSFLELSSQLLNLEGDQSSKKAELPEIPLTLLQLEHWKREISPSYESFKTNLFDKHRILKQWRVRSGSTAPLKQEDAILCQSTSSTLK